MTVAYNQSSIQLPPEAFSSSQDSRIVTLVYLTLNDVLPLRQESNDDDDDAALSANTTIVSSTIDPKPPAVLKKPVKIVLQNRRVWKISFVYKVKLLKINKYVIKFHVERKNKISDERKNTQKTIAVMYASRKPEGKNSCFNETRTHDLRTAFSVFTFTLIITIPQWKILIFF